MDFSTCYVTAGMVTFLMCIILGTAKIKDKYDKWTGEVTRDYLAYCVVGPICSIIAMLLGLFIGG